MRNKKQYQEDRKKSDKSKSNGEKYLQKSEIFAREMKLWEDRALQATETQATENAKIKPKN